jgi:dTDP-4-dehydrorhamnose reductase
LDDSHILITGANGQLGTALRRVFPAARAVDRDELDISDQQSIENFNWHNIDAIINAAAYTNVDGAETPDGEKQAYAINDKGVENLATITAGKDLLLVHISTAYVFDGTKQIYTEDDQINPLGKYAKSKAAGDEKAAKVPKHYIVRTDSVIGEGKNFVRTMLNLGKQGVAPTVVADQTIRPTFTVQLAVGIKFLIEKSPEFGIYNLTNEGEAVSWADFTRAIFKEANINSEVTDTTYKEYSAGKPGVSPRPLNSVLDLTKIEAIGFKPNDWRDDLKEYVRKEAAL